MSDTKIGNLRGIRMGRLALDQGERRAGVLLQKQSSEPSTPHLSPLLFEGERRKMPNNQLGEFQTSLVLFREALALRLRLNIGGVALSHIYLNFLCICVL